MSAPTILLVDDDEVLSQVLRRVLTRQGYEVREASSAAQAVEMAREHPPRLGLLDLCLPDGDGMELAKKLRAEGGQFPLILMTAYPVRLREHPELANGFAHVLTKPLNLQELRQAIDTALAAPANGAPAGQEAFNGPASTPSEPKKSAAPTQGRPRRRVWAAVAVVAILLVVGGLVWAMPALGMPSLPDLIKPHREVTPVAPAAPALPPVKPVPGDPNAIELPEDVHKRLDVQAVKVEKAKTPRLLELSGSLAFNADKLARVHSRFAGEVVEIAPLLVPGKKLGTYEERPLRFGDTVSEGQLLAVVWSRDLGDKKNDLVDALSQLKLDQETLTGVEKLYEQGGVSEATVRQWRRNVEGDRIAVNRARNTLRIWRLKPEEIEELEKEADRILLERAIKGRDEKRDEERIQKWARVEIRAPFDGVIVEKNVTNGEIVDTTNDLFKIANMSKLTVWANAYEEDLPALKKLKQPIPWTIHLKGDPEAKPVPGKVQEIGRVIDPTQHTALVMGWVDNPEGSLRAGQFISATVEIPPPENVVSVPTSALVEDGRDSIVFVQPDAGKRIYVMRRVAVTNRFSDVVYVKSVLTDAEKREGLQELTPGERVVTQSALEMKAAVEDFQAKAKNEK
jgi:cobalt-zinc-cadmium efflux system membrane fusion protein